MGVTTRRRMLAENYYANLAAMQEACEGVGRDFKEEMLQLIRVWLKFYAPACMPAEVPETEDEVREIRPPKPVRVPKPVAAVAAPPRIVYKRRRGRRENSIASRVLCLLQDGKERRPCDVARVLCTHAKQTTVTMCVLRKSGVLVSRTDATEKAAYYKLADPKAGPETGHSEIETSAA